MKHQDQTSLADDIRSANFVVYEDEDFVESYERGHPDVYNRLNQQRIGRLIEGLSRKVTRERYLDVGCGSGNLLKFAIQYFEKVYGVDYSTNMLSRSRALTPLLLKGEGADLPFRDDTFDCVSFYSVLHHVYDPKDLLREAFRIVRSGGLVYTDHDPNIYFMRNIWWLVKLYNFTLRKSLFAGEGPHRLAEYHHKMGEELDPPALEQACKTMGFSDVSVHYRPYVLGGKSLPGKFLNLLLRTAGRFSGKHLNYYFYIVAQK